MTGTEDQDQEMGPDFAVVVPTLGRPSLTDCLGALGAAYGPPPSEIVLVDDRPGTSGAANSLEGHALAPLSALRPRARVLRGGGRGPAAARNVGLSAVSAPWVVFVDDDVTVGPHWYEQLAEDLASAGPEVAGVQGVLYVPLPEDRRPTDRERNTAHLAHSLWITADMAYRAGALAAVGGFDPRFPRAFREDSDLALRVVEDGWRIVRGTRLAHHPVPGPDRWASVRAQRGNADDALMRRLHGAGWRNRAAAPRGRLRRHAAVTVAGTVALALAATGRRKAALAAGAAWAAGTAEFARDRIAAGPRTGEEVTSMVLTSVLIPPAAVWHRTAGFLRHRKARPRREDT
ncbi:glycosyltransferase family 2 protein [Streptomyces iconiensis]|uniref:Glycosyltransferase n=1 Tax=Streptomyces iconiensis TaxID=1384038 RepID=A0ABT6ZUS8_9ACTN|nr:glycosyltransferase [Streptomyces iconiensis]MDJ1132825.1 glycosyltransferase [Streptomyces iconiensis]